VEAPHHRRNPNANKVNGRRRVKLTPKKANPRNRHPSSSLQTTTELNSPTARHARKTELHKLETAQETKNQVTEVQTQVGEQRRKGQPREKRKKEPPKERTKEREVRERGRERGHPLVGE
jgi:hypothetical protein